MHRIEQIICSGETVKLLPNSNANNFLGQSIILRSICSKVDRALINDRDGIGTVA